MGFAFLLFLFLTVVCRHKAGGGACVKQHGLSDYLIVIFVESVNLTVMR